MVKFAKAANSLNGWKRGTALFLKKKYMQSLYFNFF
jgi:hypothetical protein